MKHMAAKVSTLDEDLKALFPGRTSGDVQREQDFLTEGYGGMARRKPIEEARRAEAARIEEAKRKGKKGKKRAKREAVAANGSEEPAPETAEPTGGEEPQDITPKAESRTMRDVRRSLEEAHRALAGASGRTAHKGLTEGYKAMRRLSKAAAQLSEKVVTSSQSAKSIRVAEKLVLLGEDAAKEAKLLKRAAESAETDIGAADDAEQKDGDAKALFGKMMDALLDGLGYYKQIRQEMGADDDSGDVDMPPADPETEDGPEDDVYEPNDTDEPPSNEEGEDDDGEDDEDDEDPANEEGEDDDEDDTDPEQPAAEARRRR